MRGMVLSGAWPLEGAQWRLSLQAGHDVQRLPWGAVPPNQRGRPHYGFLRGVQRGLTCFLALCSVKAERPTGGDWVGKMRPSQNEGGPPAVRCTDAQMRIKCPSVSEAPRTCCCLLSVRVVDCINKQRAISCVHFLHWAIGLLHSLPQLWLKRKLLCLVSGKWIRKRWLEFLSPWDFQIKSETNPSSNTNLVSVGLERSQLHLWTPVDISL